MRRPCLKQLKLPYVTRTWLVSNDPSIHVEVLDLISCCSRSVWSTKMELQILRVSVSTTNKQNLVYLKEQCSKCLSTCWSNHLKTLSNRFQLENPPHRLLFKYTDFHQFATGQHGALLTETPLISLAWSFVSIFDLFTLPFHNFGTGNPVQWYRETSPLRLSLQCSVLQCSVSFIGAVGFSIYLCVHQARKRRALVIDEISVWYSLERGEHSEREWVWGIACLRIIVSISTCSVSYNRLLTQIDLWKSKVWLV